MKYDKMLLTPWQVNDSAAAKMVQIGGSALTNSELFSVAVGKPPAKLKLQKSLPFLPSAWIHSAALKVFKNK